MSWVAEGLRGDWILRSRELQFIITSKTILADNDATTLASVPRS